MKKILLTVISTLLAILMLVGCSEGQLGEYIKEYQKPEEKPKISLNLYIITEAETKENAMVTVNQRIADYTADKFDTTVNVIYCTAADYGTTVMNKTVSGAENHADIFLINSEALMNQLLEAGRLADLTGYFASNTYGTLNAQIADSLLKASLVQVTENGAVVDKNYCVPNNHIVGTYEYLLINRQVAQRYYLGSDAKLASFTTYESTETLRGYISADISGGVLTGQVEDYVKQVSGMYQDKAKYESEGFACNVVSYPQATKADAYTGAFAISANTLYADRAMEIIYAINTDETLHNYLQYGILGTNYLMDIDEETKEKSPLTRVSEGNSVYYMNPLYTGDIFKIYYSTDLKWGNNFTGWLSDDADYGKDHNRQSQYNP